MHESRILSGLRSIGLVAFFLLALSAGCATTKQPRRPVATTAPTPSRTLDQKQIDEIVAQWRRGTTSADAFFKDYVSKPKRGEFETSAEYAARVRSVDPSKLYFFPIYGGPFSDSAKASTRCLGASFAANYDADAQRFAVTFTAPKKYPDLLLSTDDAFRVYKSKFSYPYYLMIGKSTTRERTYRGQNAFGATANVRSYTEELFYLLSGRDPSPTLGNLPHTTSHMSTNSVTGEGCAESTILVSVPRERARLLKDYLVVWVGVRFPKDLLALDNREYSGATISDPLDATYVSRAVLGEVVAFVVADLLHSEVLGVLVP